MSCGAALPARLPENSCMTHVLLPSVCVAENSGMVAGVFSAPSRRSWNFGAISICAGVLSLVHDELLFCSTTSANEPFVLHCIFRPFRRLSSRAFAPTRQNSAAAPRTLARMGIKAVESFDANFELNPEVCF